MTIKNWFVQKNFTQNEAYIIRAADAIVTKETEKAALVRFVSDYGTLTSWIPKSCIENDIEINATENEALSIGATVKTLIGKIVSIVSIDGICVKCNDGKTYVASTLRLA